MAEKYGDEQLVKVSSPQSGVVLLSLNRESKRNALSTALIVDLAAAIHDAEQSPHTRCVVLTGSGQLFSAGADIKEMRDEGFAAIANQTRVQAWASIEKTTIPIIAAVSGMCLGGGHELAMLCDVVIASEDAQFGQPEIKLGHMPGDGATQRLTRIAGKYVAMKMILSGEAISAEEAFRVGLAAEVVPTGTCVDRAIELAGQIARHSSKALGLAKDAVLAAQESFLTQGLAIERRNIAHAFTTNDQKEGLAAFFEKRPAKFTDS
jgi:enoyl-CoA hydratase